ncbi:AraC family transcriptional regulator [Paenibacillus sp. GCM10023250]|uniref:AraC family transcriptional regulator n=1 Tax=Paenibacillus sp. GCM10023250 TaxID=3252648 RepID=UPI00360D7F79
MNMNGALRYIEERLADEIDVKEAARRAYCSEYQFLRMFSFLAGLPLSEYIRRRRLTLAAFELQGGGAKVIDVALKYGYRSPDAFARAFQQLHGVMPSAVRGGGAVKAYSPISFQLTVQGGSEMNYRIVEKDAFRIVGIMKRVPVVFEGVSPEIAAMWQSLDMTAIAALKALSNVEPRGLISASANFSEGRMEERGGLDHYIGAATTEPAPDGMAALEVAASAWAVFEAVGRFPETLQQVWGRIYSEWLPSAAYELVPGPEMLWNEGKDTSVPAFRSEIWIPVRMKQALQI